VHLRRSPLARFAGLALAVAVCDLAAKQVALATLAGRDVPLAGGALRLTLVHNLGSAFGISLGPYTPQLNFTFTLAAIVLAAVTCSALAAVDRRAPVALGLIAGGALGNLASLVLPPAGVPDFIAAGLPAGFQIVFNLADVAAYAGVVLSARVGATLMREMRRERATRVAARAATRTTRRPEMVVPIPVATERPGVARGPRTRRPDATGERPVERFEAGGARYRIR
jgi:lipoprotein signal peptidase